jgi:hypothetical protein
MASRQTDESYDRTVEDSFPASDPPASTGITGPRRRGPKSRQRPPEARDDDARPKGTPTDDRHATETAYQWEHEDHTPER